MSSSRVWLITGTTTGIGHATVKEVIAADERVAAITRKASGLSKLAEEYSSEKLLVVEHDVGNPAHSAEALFEKVHTHFGRIDVVLNNAGSSFDAVAEGTSDEEARSLFEVNFWGAVRVTREAVKYFRENKTPAGRVLNISSIGGFIGVPNYSFYSASKFALEGFSESINRELPAEWNIKVIIIEPGSVRTGIVVPELPLPAAYNNPDGLVRKFRELLKTNIPPSDTIKVSHALIKISKELDPPHKLPLGADAQHTIFQKVKEIQRELEQWRELTLSTGADDVDRVALDEHLKTFC